MDSSLFKDNPAIQYLLQQAEELINSTYASSSVVSNFSNEYSSNLNSFDINNMNINDLSHLNNLKITEIDQILANQLSNSSSSSSSSLSSSKVAYGQYELGNENNIMNNTADGSIEQVSSISNYSGEIFRDSNPPDIIRRPANQGPITYRQNISVRFLQPPPVPPPGPLIIKEVRPVQPPAPAPIIIRQRAPPIPTPPPLVLREQPPRAPLPIPSKTIIKKLAPVPVPPRSVIVESYPAMPSRPRDIIIERWLPYSKEPQPRKIITHPAPSPRPYPIPRNAIIIYEPIQAHIVRSVQKLGVHLHNPEEYRTKYGNTLLDSSTLISKAVNFGIFDDLNPPSTNFGQEYLTETSSSDFHLNNAQAMFEPQHEYKTISWQSETTNNNHNNLFEVYWTNPYEDINTTLQHLGFPIG